MRRALPFLVLLSACSQSAAVLIDEDTSAPTDTGTAPIVVDTAVGEGWTDEASAWTDEPTEPDYSVYEGAYARIASPQAGDLVPIGELQTYTVEVRNPDNVVLTPTAVIWQSNIDPDFQGSEASFETDVIDPGVHTITALVDLPNGQRLAHSIAGVRVQDKAAGTYAGLFSVDGTVNRITITCTGNAILEFGDLGFVGEGDADCLVSLLGIDVPMTWLFELENTAGVIDGTGGVDLLGWFTYDIPVTGGTLDADAGTLEVDFAGPIPLFGELSAFLDAQRVAP
jgi:hypothetical protein